MKMPGPFKEGPVEISYKPSNGKQKMTLVVDFGKIEMNALSAARLVLDIVQLLRKQLNIRLPMFQT